MDDKDSTVVVVDDESRLADLFATWLGDRWDVEVTYDGESALSTIDESTAVVLLDRRMPGTSGDDVLDELRERGLECRVIMVTAVDPDFDIVEMPFDEYLVKPITREELVETVDRVLMRMQYNEKMREYYSLVSKKAVLETEKQSAELAGSDEYDRLTERVEELEEEVDRALEQITEHDEFTGPFRDLRTE